MSVCFCCVFASWCCNTVRRFVLFLVHVFLSLLSPCPHRHSKDCVGHHAVVCLRSSHDPRYCYLLLAGIGALCIGGRSCLGVSNSDMYVIRAFPSVSSLPVVCVEVVRAKLTSVLLQVTSAMHSAKLSLLDPHLAAFLLAFHLGLPVCHGQNPPPLPSTISRSDNRSAWQSRYSTSCHHPPPSNIPLLPHV
jgi:hypothetical protein